MQFNYTKITSELLKTYHAPFLEYHTVDTALLRFMRISKDGEALKWDLFLDVPIEISQLVREDKKYNLHIKPQDVVTLLALIPEEIMLDALYRAHFSYHDILQFTQSLPN